MFIAREGFPRVVVGVVEPDAEASGPTGRGAGLSDKCLESVRNISGTHILIFLLANGACLAGDYSLSSILPRAWL